MLTNYFKIAWRNLKRHKAYAFINVFGLSLGIACAILIFTIVSYHLSFDRFHSNKDRIYRAYTEFHGETVDRNPGVPSPLGKALRNDFTFADKVARVITFNDILISLPQEKQVKKFEEASGVGFVEPAFFDILNFPLVQGDKKTALSSPNSAIITQTLAKKYFNTEDAIGKVIRMSNKTNYTITGIMKDLPANTDRRQEIYLSYENLKERNEWLAGDSSWSGVYSESQCFLLLKPGVTQQAAEKQMAAVPHKYYTGRDVQQLNFRLQPLAEMHFDGELNGNADKRYLWALSFIGLFLVLTACVNFVNLATAQALNRSKEVGIRKVLGSLRSQLFWQFIAETTIITVIAIAFAYWLAKAGLPYLNRMFEEQMSISILLDLRLLVFIVLLCVVVIFMAGSYPGLVLARFKPIIALKSKISQKSIGGFSLRRILVVTQFAISQMLIIGTLVIAGQMNYSKTKDLGFDKEAIVVIPVPSNDKTKMTTMKSRLQSLPGVDKLSYCYMPPAAGNNNNSNPTFENKSEPERWSVNIKNGDDQYIGTFGVKLIAGRNLYPSDTIHEYLVNETFVKKLNIASPQEIIGKTITIDGVKKPIVGVVKDFYNYSLRSNVAPIIIGQNISNYGNCAVKINMKNVKTVLPAIEKIWNETYPENVYSYSFLDDRIARFYIMDTIMLKLVVAFAGIAILIGCLGLYGLVSFMALRKTKEIGVRKVLGASVPDILWIFGREFSQLLLIAFVVAAPLAWWAMNKYLQDFKFRINIGLGIFVLAILGTFIIAAITVVYKSVKAAIANPVKSLRTE
ncbi:MAG: ABC transporter permease [Filimonas sp.]|nr:ABC transporter permease [Filimonas sp.]